MTRPSGMSRTNLSGVASTSSTRGRFAGTAAPFNGTSQGPRWRTTRPTVVDLLKPSWRSRSPGVPVPTFSPYRLRAARITWDQTPPTGGPCFTTAPLSNRSRPAYGPYVRRALGGCCKEVLSPATVSPPTDADPPQVAEIPPALPPPRPRLGAACYGTCQSRVRNFWDVEVVFPSNPASQADRRHLDQRNGCLPLSSQQYLPRDL